MANFVRPIVVIVSNTDRHQSFRVWRGNVKDKIVLPPFVSRIICIFWHSRRNLQRRIQVIIMIIKNISNKKKRTDLQIYRFTGLQIYRNLQIYKFTDLQIYKFTEAYDLDMPQNV